MSALDTQIDGGHYKDVKIQPIELAYKLGASPAFCKLAKYLSRDKGDKKINLNLGKLPLLIRSIVAWSFAEDGKPIPVNPDTISRLRARYREPILTKIDELQTQAGQFLKNSPMAST